MSYKGSWSRVSDHKAFASNYDLAFRKKEPAPTSCEYCGGCGQYLDIEGLPRLCEECQETRPLENSELESPKP